MRVGGQGRGPQQNQQQRLEGQRGASHSAYEAQASLQSAQFLVLVFITYDHAVGQSDPFISVQFYFGEELKGMQKNFE